MIKDAKANYYSTIITENKSNQKVLFNTVDKLLHRKSERRYPTASSADEFANQFADFFHNKVASIRNDLSVECSSVINPYPETPACNVELTEFQDTTESAVSSLINSSSLKSCDLDPFPATVLKGCIDTLLPVLTKIINLSMETATMPTQLKEAMVKPKLKKDSLDFEIFPNFRPISNLKFVSKITEKAVACQLTDYLRDNGLEELFQSAYKSYHSTETALVKVQNDILCAIDNQHYCY